APIKPPIIRKPLIPSGMMLQYQISTPPARKVSRCPADVENGGARVPRIGVPAPYISPSLVTVRRVDVRPQAETKKPQRALLLLRPRQTAQVYLPPSPMLARAGMIPPASPAFTRISNASSRGSARKHPSLHRSKSDLSDRYSRATATWSASSTTAGWNRWELRSVSTPSSECGEEMLRTREEADEEDSTAKANERAPYGISVIERNARARDTNNAVSNV
ncbi:hypothetical protein KUCAC02_012224, partial [Chaenocephalus aceratus]